MNKKLKKLESIYWNVSKIVGILFTLFNYHMWTESFNIIKAVLLMVGVAIGIFVGINIFDLIVGLIVDIFKYIKRTIKDRRILKGFYGTNE